jgi:hypothetical protein
LISNSQPQLQSFTTMVLPIINFLLAGGVLYIAFLAGGLS